MWGTDGQADAGTHAEAVDQRWGDPGAQEESSAVGRLRLRGCQHQTPVLDVLSCQQEGASQGWSTVLGGRGRLWATLPKPSLIRGARERPQLMGGNWKRAPTHAREATTVWTRSGWAASGPAVHKRTGSERVTRQRARQTPAWDKNLFFQPL